MHLEESKPPLDSVRPHSLICYTCFGVVRSPGVQSGMEDVLIEAYCLTCVFDLSCGYTQRAKTLCW